MSHFFQAFGRDEDAFRDALQERTDLFGSGRTTKGDQQHRVVGQSHRLTSPGAKLMYRFDHGDDILDRSFRQNSMTQVEYMSRFATGASENFGDTSTDVLGEARSAAGSRFPWMPTSCPKSSQAVSRFTLQSTPITSPPAARRDLRNPPVPVLKWMTGTPGVKPAIVARVWGRANLS